MNFLTGPSSESNHCSSFYVIPPPLKVKVCKLTRKIQTTETPEKFNLTKVYMARYLEYFRDFFNGIHILLIFLTGDLILYLHNTLNREKEDILKNYI